MSPQEALMLMRSEAGLDHGIIAVLEGHLGAEPRAAS
jgi:hypothetical protein